jgi:tetratricopeptide (TPR) repeat protein
MPQHAIKKKSSKEVKKPFYQHLFTWLIYILIGYGALGAFLDATSNALSLLSGRISLFLSLSVTFMWLLGEVLLMKYHPLWIEKQGHKVRLKSLGIKARLGLAGAIVLLSIPWIGDLVKGSDPKNSATGMESGKVDSEKDVKPPPETLTGKLIILVADFEGPDPQNYRVTDVIYSNLVRATRKYPEVEIKRLKDTISAAQGSEVAREKGRNEKAQIVIWGWYGKPKLKMIVDAHFEVLQNSIPLPFHQSDETVILEEAKIETFEVQLQLSREMKYLVLLCSGLARYQKRDYEEAITRFNEALAETSVPEQIVYPGAIYFYRGSAFLHTRQLELAFKDFSKAVEIDPGRPENYTNRGTIFLAKGQIDAAIDDFSKALTFNPKDWKGYINRGGAYFGKKRYDLAVQDYSEAIRLHPNDDASYYNRAMVYIKMNQCKLAIPDLTDVIKLKPSESSAYVYRGHCLFSEKDIDNAIADFTQAIPLLIQEISNKKKHRVDFIVGSLPVGIADEDTRQAVYAYMFRGMAYLLKNDKKSAFEDFDKAIETAPGFYSSYETRAQMYLAIGDKAKAVEDLKKALPLAKEASERESIISSLHKLGAQ